MGTDTDLVLVVRRSTLLRGDSWLGVREDGVGTTLETIAKHGRYLPRGQAEHDTSHKQIIPYLLLRDGERIFLMRRSRAGSDDRLHDRWSIGIGGHLDPGDAGVLGGLQREFAEEMEADWAPEPVLLGLLNDDREAVGQVHLGVVFVAEAAGRPIRVRETDKLSGRFVEPDEVRRVYADLETWSQHVFDHLSTRRSEA